MALPFRAFARENWGRFMAALCPAQSRRHDKMPLVPDEKGRTACSAKYRKDGDALVQIIQQPTPTARRSRPPEPEPEAKRDGESGPALAAAPMPIDSFPNASDWCNGQLGPGNDVVHRCRALCGPPHVFLARFAPKASEFTRANPRQFLVGGGDNLSKLRAFALRLILARGPRG